jgi:hypothetical protein
MQLARKTDGEIADVDHLLHFAQRFLRDLARLDGDEPSELGLVGAKLVAETADEPAANGRRYRPPERNAALARCKMAKPSSRVVTPNQPSPAVDR